jgi:hypothetical protein
MHKGWKVAAVALASAMATTFTVGGIDAAGSVKTTKDDCMTAWATLMASHPTVHAAFPHQEYKEAILNVVKWHPHWNSEIGPTPGGGYFPGVSQKFELLTFDTRFVEGGTAYVAHCGHGATCNELAREVLKSYPELGSPQVDCTLEPPHVLENPQAF